MKQTKIYYISMLFIFFVFNFLIILIAILDRKDISLPIVEFVKNENIQEQTHKKSVDSVTQNNNSTNIITTEKTENSNNNQVKLSISPPNNFKSTKQFLYISGETLPNLDVKVGEVATKSNNNGEFSLLVFLEKSENIFKIEVLDPVSQEVLSEKTVKYYFAL